MSVTDESVEDIEAYAEMLVQQLRSNADAHRESAGTERRRAADTIESLLELAALRRDRALDAAFAVREFRADQIEGANMDLWEGLGA